MQCLEGILSSISNCLWGYGLLFILIGTHIYLTFRLKFIQKHIFKAIKLSFSRDTSAEGDVSPFAALTTSLAATIGTGNIVGVATAVAAGGPGAIFWMWISGFFGISTKYSEALLSVKYRITNENGEMAGGPMYVLERGLKSKKMAIFFAAAMILSGIGSGNLVQANSISAMVGTTFGVPAWVTGIVLSIAVGIVVIGGIKSIGKVCEKLVPIMAVLYILGCLTILILNYHEIPATFSMIIRSAFSGHAAFGGFVGATVREAVRFGIARGLFSNESGMGSAAVVAAAARTKNPVNQALISSTATFWDTIVTCLLTGLVLVNSGKWGQGLDGAALTKSAFSTIPYLGASILNFGLFTFVFSTILGWSYYAEKAMEYIFGTKVIFPFRLAWTGLIFLGSVASLTIVWSFADIANGLMTLPNLLSLILLTPIIIGETKKYLPEEIGKEF
jgi:alanine or glycine:cation symporter, AGCS family